MTCFATIPGMYERTITVNGFSKGYCMTGYRIGYCACPSQRITNAVALVQGHNTSCVSPLTQNAAIAALCNPDEVEVRRKEMVSLMLTNREVVLTELSKLKRIKYVVPDGAFYVMLDVSKIYEGEEKP